MHILRNTDLKNIIFQSIANQLGYLGSGSSVFSDEAPASSQVYDQAEDVAAGCCGGFLYGGSIAASIQYYVQFIWDQRLNCQAYAPEALNPALMMSEMNC